MSTLFSFLTAPFRWLGRIITFLRNTVLNGLFLFLILILGASFFADKKVLIQEKSALLLTLAGNVVEEKKDIDPIGEFLNEQLDVDDFPSEILLQDILDVINHGAGDTRISCLVLDLDRLNQVGLDQLQVIGKALEDFKKSGKQIIAADDSYNQKQYFLASYADTIFLNPDGAVHINGFGRYRLYLREALEKLRIQFHVFKVGEYKSAVEIYTRDSMSSQARQQNRMWLTSLWDSYTSTITRQRDLSPESIDELTNNFAAALALTKGDAARLALEHGLVDELKSRAEIQAFMTTLSAPDSDNGYRSISFRSYLHTIPRSYRNVRTDKDKVGLIIAGGTIYDGRKPVGSIGGDSLAGVIHQAAHDPSIKGVVLRINSGGGSAFASEIIRQEILEFKKTGKPFVVSMGTLAASGGYWIAADADEIWASAVTLTGSIGIFGLFPTFENSLANLGIRSDGVGTTNMAASINLTRPLPPMVQESMQLRIEHGYDRFLSIVATGRKMDRTVLEEIAGGRVFTGKEGLRVGLIDHLGTLEDAIASAASKANLKEYTTQYVSGPLSLKARLLRRFSSTLVGIFSSRFLADILPSSLLRPLLRSLHPFREPLTWNDPQGIYAHSMLMEF